MKCNVNFTNLSLDNDINYTIGIIKSRFRKNQSVVEAFNEPLSDFCKQHNINTASSEQLEDLSKYISNSLSFLIKILPKKGIDTSFLNSSSIFATLTNYLGVGNKADDNSYSTEFLEQDKPAETRKAVNSTFLDHAYGNAVKIRMQVEQSVLSNFVNSMFVHRAVDENDSNYVVTTNYQLNKNLNAYKQTLMDSILDYIKDKNGGNLPINLESYRNLYNEKGLLIPEKLDMSVFEKDFINITESELIDLYNNSKNKKTANLKYNAYNAYVILRNFDTFLVLKYDKAIEFKKFNSHLGNNYFLKNKSTGNITSWRDKEDQDVKDVIDIVTRNLITTSPKYKFGSSTPIANSYVSFQDFSSVVSNLNNMIFDENVQKCVIKKKGEYDTLSDYTKKVLNTYFETTGNERISLSEIVNNIRLNPQKWSKVLFEILCDTSFVDTNKQRLYNVRIDYDTIYSLNKSIFTGDKSLQEICLNYQNNNYYSYITQALDSISKVNYIQYYRNEDNVIASRTLYEQKISEIQKRLEEDINYSNSDLTKYNITELTGDNVINNLKLEFTIPETNISIIVDSKNNVIVKNLKINSSDEFKNIPDFEAISNFIFDFLKVDLKNPDFYESINTNIVKTAGQNLIKFASRVLLNKYINQQLFEIKKDGNGTIITNRMLLKYFPENEHPKLDNTTNLMNVIAKIDVPNLINIAKSKAEAQGFANSVIIKDGDGNAQSNVSLSRLYGKLGTQFQNQCKSEKSIIKNSLLMTTPGLFSNIYTAKEFKDILKTTQHTDFTVSDFAYIQIVKDFVGGFTGKSELIGNGKIAIYPCVNSDKNTLARIIIDTNKVVIFTNSEGKTITKVLKNLKINEFYELINYEFSNIYNNMFNNIIDDLYKILNDVYENKAELLVDYLHNFEKLNQKFGILTKLTLLQRVKDYNNTHKKEIVALTDQIHFISNKDGSISASKGLIQNLYRFIPNYRNNIDSNKIYEWGLKTNEEFWSEKHSEIVESWIKDGIFLDLKNTKQPEIKKIRDNAVIKENWISNSGKLIVAKYTPKFLDKSFPITDSSSLRITELRDFIEEFRNDSNKNLSDFEILKANGTFELNPLVECFNQYDYLFSQEFMIATVGTYLAHPSKNGAKNALGIIAGNYQAQAKRNVSNTAQMHQFQLNLLNGIPSIYNIACVEDIKDTQVSFSGITEDGLKPYDGATFVNPFIVYLENNSLGGQRVGVHKKNFSHFYDEHTGTGGIIKTAGFGLTNEWMRECKTLQTMMYNMTNRKWEDLPCTQNILKDYNGNDINIGEYYFKSGKNYYKAKLRKLTEEEIQDSINNGFTDLYELSHTYIRETTRISRNGKIYSEVVEGNLATVKPETSLIVIDSNYSLWQALGGLYSCSFEEDGLLWPSEISISKTVDIINSVGEKTIDQNDTPFTQEDVYQPLKHSDVHYMVTAGAIKQGAANMNPNSAYFEKTDLNYMQIKMNHSGIQLDKEHGADKEDLSLMTQVVGACAAKGFTYEKADVLYQALRYNTTIRTKEFHDIFKDIFSDKSIESGALRKAITKVIVNSIEFSSGTKSLLDFMAENLVKAAQEGNLDLNEEAIAGSENGVYNKIVSILTVYFNKAGIKVKVPGVLAVMTPSYELFKLYKGKKLSQYDDEIENWDDEPVIATHELMFDKTYVIQGEVEEVIKIKKHSDYLKVRNAMLQGIPVLERVSAGYNLPSYNVKFKGTTEEGKETILQLYDLDIVGLLFNLRETSYPGDEEQLEILNNNITELNNRFFTNIPLYSTDIDFESYMKSVISIAMKVYQKSLDVLSGKSSEKTVLVGNETVTVDLNSVKEYPYGLAMSKNFATNFGLSKHDQLSDIRENPYFFTKKLINSAAKSNTDFKNYSLKLTKLNGNHVYLTNLNNIPDGLQEVDIKKQIDVDGSVYRLNETGDGSIMYQLSNTKDKVFKDPKTGTEIIATDDFDFYINNESYNDIIISPTLSDDTISSIIQSLKNSYNKIARNYFYNIATIENDIETVKTFIEERINTYKNLLKSSDLNQPFSNSNNNIHLDYIQQLGNTIKASWEKSLDIVAARIPAQSMQSFMPMEICAYVDSDVNVAYVNTSQIWLQGSDY